LGVDPWSALHIGGGAIGSGAVKKTFAGAHVTGRLPSSAATTGSSRSISEMRAASHTTGAGADGTDGSENVASGNGLREGDGMADSVGALSRGADGDTPRKWRGPARSTPDVRSSRL